MTPYMRNSTLLLEALGARISKYGFTKRVRQSFYKPFELGRFACHLNFARHSESFDAAMDVAIRFDALEDLLNERTKHLSAREKKNTFSMGVELGNLSHGQRICWKIANESDVERVADQMLELFKKVALPYFEEYSNMENALKVLSQDGPDAWLHSPFHHVRAMRAVGLAKLIKDDETVRTLIEHKRAYLESRCDRQLPEFLAFIETLDLQ